MSSSASPKASDEVQLSAIERGKQLASSSFSTIMNVIMNLSLGWKLVLTHLLIGLPFAFLVTWANKFVISYLGYEKIMRCPSGILGSRILFVALNLILILTWGSELEKEERARGEKKELGYWKRVVRWLEGERKRVGGLQAREAEEQLLSEAKAADGKKRGKKITTITEGPDRAGKEGKKRKMVDGGAEVEVGYGTVGRGKTRMLRERKGVDYYVRKPGFEDDGWVEEGDVEDDAKEDMKEDTQARKSSIKKHKI